MKTLSENLISLQDAEQKIKKQLTPIKRSVTVPLIEAVGRITSSPIYSSLNVPSFDNSAMDGYAVRLNDIKINESIPIIGTVFSGNAFNGIWPKGSALRIMTGAPIPKGCDAIIIKEHTRLENDSIILTQPVYYKQNIRYKGEDIKLGDRILNSGVHLGSAELPLLASIGITEVNVLRKLRVAYFSTGNELQSVGFPLEENQIYDINRFTLSLMLSKLDLETIDLGIIPDDPDEICNIFKKADGLADVVISTGAISVGDADYIKKILKYSSTINFWKLAIKPGKPFAFGKFSNSWFFGLPGNPVSVTVIFYHLVQPMLIRLAGQSKLPIKLRQRARVTEFLKKSPGRVEFQRGILSLNKNNGILEVVTTGSQDSHIFSSFSLADCFIILEYNRGNVQPGEWVDIEIFNSLFKR